jgi:EmrB/QacA subfamily drug resistance transporter
MPTTGGLVGWTSAQRWVLSLTALASLMVVLDALVVTTALDAIRLDLGASLEELEWTVSAYVLSFAVPLMTAAALGDRFGRRHVFTIGLGVFAAASAACALAPDVGWLIAARAVQGIGAALLMPLALTLLGAAFPPQQRPRALGMLAAVSGLSVVLGPLLGGAVVEGISWPWIFWLNVPAGLALILLAPRRIEESFGPNTALDIRGLALVTGGVVGIVWGLVRGNTAGWGSVEVLSALGLGVLLTLAFVRWELRACEPMLPMRLFRSPAFSAGNAAIFCLWGSTLGALFFMAQFLQTGLGYGPLGTGLRLMPWGLTTFIVPPVAAALVGRFGERPFIVAGMSLNALSLAWIALIAEPDLAYWKLVAPMILGGAGIAMAMPTIQGAVLASVALRYIGKASGTYNTMRQLGGAFGLAVVVAVFAATGGYASTQEFSDGFVAAIAAGAALSLAGAGAGVALRGRRAQRPPRRRAARLRSSRTAEVLGPPPRRAARLRSSRTAEVLPGGGPRLPACQARRTGSVFSWLMKGDSAYSGLPASSIAG